MGRAAGSRRSVCSDVAAVPRRCLDDEGKLPAGNRLSDPIPTLKENPARDS
jgi:hypothetical protein